MPTGYPVFTRYKNWNGFENQHLRVLKHDRYDTATRRHHWLLLCKHCDKEFLSLSFNIKDRKSCGCRAHLGRFKKNDESFDSGALLRKSW